MQAIWLIFAAISASVAPYGKQKPDFRPAVCIWESMTRSNVPILNRIAATGLAVAVACMGYAGFLHMFDQDLLACLVGAVLGGFTLGRLSRAERKA